MMKMMLAAVLALAAADFIVEKDEYKTDNYTALVVRLRNEETGEHAEMIYNMGGRVESVLLTDPAAGHLREVLATHDRNATAIMTNPHWQGEILLPYANRIANATYIFNNTRYILPMNEPARNNSIHGLIWDKTLDIAASRADNKSASVTLAYDFANTDPGYPFKLHVALTYTLDKDGRFTISVAATNTEDGWPVPFFNSWHPYFLVEDVSKAVVLLDSCAQWAHMLVYNNSNFYSNLIPTGETKPWTTFNGAPVGGTADKPTYYDDEFKSLAACDSYEERVQHGDIESVLFHDSSYRFVQVFTGGMINWNLSAIAVEAMSAAADAFNNHNGLHVIDAGETFESSFGVFLQKRQG